MEKLLEKHPKYVLVYSFSCLSLDDFMIFFIVVVTELWFILAMELMEKIRFIKRVHLKSRLK